MKSPIEIQSEGNSISLGRIASAPYMSEKGFIPFGIWMDVWYTHKVGNIFKCQSWVDWLMAHFKIWTKVLFKSSA